MERSMFYGREGVLSGLTIRVAAVVLLTAVLVPADAAAEGGIGAYALTDSALAKFERAQKNLAAVEPSARGGCDATDGDDSSAEAMAARIDARPEARAAIESAGLSSLEYAQFVMAVMQAGLASWALDQPGGQLPADASMTNVKFYRANEARLAAAGSVGPTADCEE
jgi:hypothetical protein